MVNGWLGGWMGRGVGEWMGDGERGGWSHRALRNPPQSPLAGRRWLRARLSLPSPLQPVWDTSAVIWSFTGRPPSKRRVFQSAEGRGKGNLLPAASNMLCRGLRQLKESGKRGADPTGSLWLPSPLTQASQHKPGKQHLSGGRGGPSRVHFPIYMFLCFPTFL